jgi:hypothetical protein
MSSQAITVTFTGPALDAGSIDVRDLAPVLLAFGKVFEEANHLLNDGQAQIYVRVRADFARGSFKVNLEVVQRTLDRVADFFKGRDKVTDAMSVAGLLMGAPSIGVPVEVVLIGGGVIIALSVGVIVLRRIMRGRQAPGTTLEDGRMLFEIDDEYYVIEREAVPLLESPVIQEQLAKVVSPLARDGMDSIEFRQGEDGAEDVLRIEKADVVSFTAPFSGPGDQVLPDQRYKKIYQLHTIVFEEGRKWSVRDGSNRVSVTIDDLDFFNAVARGDIALGGGDTLLCEVLERQAIKRDGSPKSELTITKVLEHRRGAMQLALPY